MKQFKMKGGGLMVLLMVIALTLTVGACKTGTDGTGIPDDNEGVDYRDYTTNFAFLVTNNTSEDLVAFRGELNSGYILGGIPAGATQHGIRKNPALFNTTADFPMILITKQQYAKNKNNLIALKETPFTRVYVFYNHSLADGTPNTKYQISGRIGGDFKLTVQNPTNYNVELRLGGVNGETIGYAANGMLTTTLWVNEGDFNIFPVFKKYNVLRDTIETLYPQGASGYAWFQSLGFDSSAPGGKEKTFNVKTAVDTLLSRTSGVAWLSIDNQTYPSNAIHLKDGLNVIRTTAGVSYFDGIKTFQIDMARTPVGNSSTFASSRVINGYAVGPDGFEVPIFANIDATSAPVGGHTLDVDMLYTVTVTGDHNQGTLKAYFTGTPEAVDPATF